MLGWLALAAVLFLVFFAPILHWSRTDAGFFDRTRISHATWKWLWTVGIFTATLPVMGLLWWYLVVRDRIARRENASQEAFTQI